MLKRYLDAGWILVRINGSHHVMRKGNLVEVHPCAREHRPWQRAGAEAFEADEGGRMKYHFKVHKEKKGFWAEGIELPFANTEADTEEELYANMKEVLEMFLDDHKSNEGLSIPLPAAKVKGKRIVEVSPDPKIALAFLIRKERIEAKMSQSEAAKRLGIKHISQYQRLESGKTANAELGTLAKLKRVFPSLSVDAVLA